MTNEKLAELMNENNADLEYLEELTDALHEEMAKPKEERNYEEIKELTEAISVICGAEQYFAKRTEEGIAKLNETVENSDKSKKRRYVFRRLVPAVAAVVIITANVFSYTIFGMNAFSSAIRIHDGSIQISFSNEDNGKEGDGKTENPYSQQMLEKCKEAGFTPLVPNYLPSNMKPTDSWGETNNESSIPGIGFYFSDGKNRLNIRYINIKNAQNGFELGMPANSNDIREEVMNGVTVYFIKKADTEFHISFQKNHIIHEIASDGLEEAEIRKVINSMFGNI